MRILKFGKSRLIGEWIVTKSSIPTRYNLKHSFKNKKIKIVGWEETLKFINAWETVNQRIKIY